MQTSEIVSWGFNIALFMSVVYTQWKSGATKISSEVLANYEKLVAQLREQNSAQHANHQGQMSEIKTQMVNMEKGFIAKIAKIEGALDEKEKQNAEMAKILANRNPELENVLREIRDFMKNLNDTNLHQTQILEASQTRDKVIDSQTDAQVGNVLRK